MYKCMDCGHLFDECEAGTGKEFHNEVDGGAVEIFAVCPCCKSSDFEETVQCECCHGEFLANELRDGWCDECLCEAIDYESFYEFATTGVQNAYDLDTIEDFIFTEVFRVDAPKYGSAELKAYCKELYKREVANEKILGTTSFLSKIYNYVRRVNLKDELAEFLSEKARELDVSRWTLRVKTISYIKEAKK